jgi:predicted NACHT family NTPase
MYMVILFDKQKEIFALLAHNLSKPEAKEHARGLRRDKLPSYIVKQKKKDHSGEAASCALCKQALDLLKED